MDVLGWLRNLGLEQYEAIFRDNDIDASLLSSLTNEDLKEIGVASLGHRRKLLEAIAVLRAEQAGAAVGPTLVAGTEAERRQLTLMFCDLVGSTPLASRFDPEDLSEIIRTYHRTVADAMGRFDGFVAKYMGDGVLTYFGYPQAHEDDAERAVRAGLAVIEAVKRLELPERLAVRIGVATGLVVVGELIGEGTAQERGVVGETPNLAARLQALAELNSLVVADATRRQIGALFEVEDLGTQLLAGFADPQRAWRVVAESGVVNRFEALRSGTTPLVGREEELDLLLAAWRQAKTGEGRVVLISGEPGIGKSRLVAELAQRVEGEPHIRLRWFCSPYHQDSALYPIISQLEHAGNFARDDTAEEKRAKLNTLLGQAAASADEIELIAELVSLPNSVADLNLTPQRKRQLLLEALVHQPEGLARNRPVLMLFEDAHWSDASSRELFGLTINRLKDLPIALVITFRPEFAPPWGDRPYLSALTLDRLSGSEGARLVENLAGTKPLSLDVIGEIVERTDGVPLFVEELTKAVLESDDPGDRLAIVTASPTPSLAIPATLHASLISRLDRLGPAAKEVAQIGAVLGREFSYELIHHVARRPDLETALAQLADAGLLLRRGLRLASSYLFKHAMVQDAAYATLLHRRRQQLHGRVAAVLETDFADLVERQPELLAQHLSAAGEHEKAIEYWFRAGERAKVRSADHEAAALLRSALRLAEQLPDRETRSAWELRILIALGPALIVRDMTAPEVDSVYDRARRLARETGRSIELFRVLWGSWLTSLSSGDMHSATALKDELLVLARQQQSEELLLQAHHAGWTTGLLCGELRAALSSIDAGLPLYRQDAHGHHALLYGGHDPGACGHTIAGMILALLGRLDRARSEAVEAVSLGRSLGHHGSLGHAYQFASETHYLRRDAAALDEIVREMLPFAAEHGSAVAVAHARMVHGWVLIAGGHITEGLAALRDGLSAFRRTGSKMYGAFRLSRAADGLLLAGEIDEALSVLAEATALAAETGERWSDAILDWLRGTAMLRRPGGPRCDHPAEEHFRRAIAMSHESGAILIELRAATSLARLWTGQGRRAEAHQLLAPVYGRFTEGFDTADLKDAKALLDDLA